MAVEGEVVEVKRGTCMPRAEVTVSALSSEWPFPMCLSCVLPDRCTRDQGLCCYACWCAVCAHAEVAEQNGIRGLLFQKQWYLQCTVILCANLLAWVFCSPCCSCIWAPCIMTAYGTQVRRAVKRKYGLPDDECCGPTCSTYLPAYLSIRCVPILFPNQTQCAAYQMLYFMRYTRKGPAPECPCYKYCCVHCSPPAAGAEEDKYQRVSRQVGKTLRSADHHILEDLTDNLHNDVQDGSPFAKDDAVTTTQPT